MGLFDNLESKLSSMVNGAFAKAFKSSVQPVEIASAIRTAMDDKAAVVGRGRTIVPNLYTIALSPSDYDQLSAYAEGLTDELVAAAEDHADSQRYQPAGPVRVILSQDPQLETGVFRLRPASAKDPFTRDHERAPGGQSAGPRGDYAGGRDDYADGAAAQGRAGGAAYEAGAAHVPGGVAESGLAGPRLPLDDQQRRVAPMREESDRARDYLDDEGLGATQVQQPVQPPEQRPRLDPTRRPWLDIDGDRYPLLGAITVIGRDGVADIVLDDPGISRRHAEIRVHHDGPHLVGSIRDLGSTNGTFVEGHRVTSQRLADGDRVTIGRTSFTFRLGKR
ncbi:FhaA domain-containing protein [Arsenicicoccus sp. oral taxon 190]|uniref:FhaA domain-containing protein n=1 Tax=Arsenicicoccus sp. oral taxon 190 TaxID=1658671 RepID=UPI00067A2B78|nr:DUF3662 and FHA domain-containing protein [Arsenicicoccus sp. oral taxon 190]AKT50833.1 hypothetical protein ADJ73_05075 [Arsenicicoccus sp. oral taxon 190]